MARDKSANSKAKADNGRGVSITIENPTGNLPSVTFNADGIPADGTAGGGSLVEIYGIVRRRIDEPPENPWHPIAMSPGEVSGSAWWFGGSNRVPGAVSGSNNALYVIGLFEVASSSGTSFIPSDPAAQFFIGVSGRFALSPGVLPAIGDQFPVAWRLIRVGQKRGDKPPSGQGAVKNSATDPVLKFDKKSSTSQRYVWKSAVAKTTPQSWRLDVRQVGSRYVGTLGRGDNAAKGAPSPSKSWTNQSFFAMHHNVMKSGDGSGNENLLILEPILAPKKTAKSKADRKPPRKKKSTKPGKTDGNPQ